MTSSLRAILLSCLALPLAAQGAVYKCTVDGKTAYQQQPCDAGAAQREVVPATPSAKRSPSAVPSSPAQPPLAKASEPGASAAKGELDAAGREALARDAFGALKSRDLVRFDALLCDRARKNYARPDLKGVLQSAASGIANRRSELGEVQVNEPKRVNFATTISEPGGSSTTRVPDAPFSVELQREADGRTCVSEFGSLAGKGK
jgi:hypothetical protein